MKSSRRMGVFLFCLMVFLSLNSSAQMSTSISITRSNSVGGQYPVASAMSPLSAQGGGGYVVTWSAYDGTKTYVSFQKYDSSGTPLGAETVIDTLSGYQPTTTKPVGLPDGGFVVVSVLSSSNFQPIFSQRFDANGSSMGAKSLIATGQDPSVSMIASGGALPP